MVEVKNHLKLFDGGGVMEVGNKRRALTPEEMQAVRRRLAQRKYDLWKELIEVLEREAGEGYQDLIQTMRDEGDRALVELRGSAVFSLLKLKVEELDTIERALRRIDKDKYGHCMDCGRWICAARLQIMPHAVRCRDCQEKWEKAHRL